MSSPAVGSVDAPAMPEDFSYRLQASTLRGSVTVPGAKNSALKLLTASLLTDQLIVLQNYPAQLLDAKLHVEMLERLGKRCTLDGDCLQISENGSPVPELTWSKRSIRNTLLMLGALTARHGHAAVPLPGGCKLGDRKFDLHVMVLEKLGATVTEKDGQLMATAGNGLVGTDIELPLRSTGATENAILCGTLASRTTRIWNPHIRPEILDLIAMLRKMGAEIEVHGQEHIAVAGRPGGLGGAVHEVVADNLEAITWLIAATITGGDLTIRNFPASDLEVPLIHLRESGAKYFRMGDEVIVRDGRCYPVDISTGPFPGINSDMQPLFAAFGACARGESRIVDLRFPGRYAYAQEFRQLGVACEIRDNLLIINGGRRLTGTTVRATDLRAGIALVLLGLVAGGETIVEDAWQVERGYSNFVQRLRSLGAQIEYRDAG